MHRVCGGLLSRMTVHDNRLDRRLSEMIATTTTLTEQDLRSYRPGDYDDPDHELYAGDMDELVEKLEDDQTTRRAITLADSPERCIVGVHVLIREKIHIISWFRSSDKDEYRDDDLGFLYWFGRKIRKELNLNRRLMVHVFTSSLHSELNGPELADINEEDN